MKIGGAVNTGNTPTVETRTGGTRAARGDTPAASGETVRLSTASAELGGGEVAIDLARVGEIRQAVSEGRFQINAGAIADRLIATARELVDSQRKA